MSASPRSASRKASSQRPRKTPKTAQTRKPSNDSESPKRSRAQHYTPDEKRAAVTAVLTVSRDHPFSIDALQAASAVLGAPVVPSTLVPWLERYRAEIEPLLPKAPSLDSIVATTRETLTRNLSELTSKVSQHALQDKTIAEASLRDSAVVLGISIDKLSMLSGLSPAMNTLAQQLERACTLRGIDALSIMQDMIDSVIEAEPMTIDSTAEPHP